MKISVSNFNKKSMSKFLPICNVRSPLPILSNLLLSANNNKLSIMAFNLEVSVKEEFDAEVIEPGSITVSGKKLSDIIDKLTSERIDIVSTEHTVTIEQGTSKFMLHTLSADDFPVIYEFPGQEITVETGILLDAVKKVSYAVSSDDSRFNLNAMFWDADKFVATDGHRLAKMELPFKIEGKALIPQVGCQSILKCLGANNTCKITVGEKFISITSGDVTLNCRMLDGDFPDYTRVIPTESGISLLANTNELTQVLKRVTPMAIQTDMGIKVVVSNNKLTVSKESSLGSAEDSMTVESDGDFDFIANAKYLTDCLANINTESTVMSFIKEGAPIVFKPEDNETFMSLVMPMRK